MPKVKVNDIRMYYEIHGQGEPLVLIMGLGANTSDWEMQIPTFSRQYKVVAMDNRDCGRTDKVATPYTMETLADDTAGLMEALAISSAHVYGQSMGGMIAQELALRHPHKVRTLILAATTFGGPHAVFPTGSTLQDWAALSVLPPAEAIERGLPFLYTEEFIARKKKEELIKSRLKYAHLRPPIEALQRQFQPIIQFNAYDRLPQIHAPTLILTGSADKIMPAENARILAQRIPGALLVELEGSGHGFLVEKAEESNAVVLDFLSRHQQGAAK